MKEEDHSILEGLSKFLYFESALIKGSCGGQLIKAPGQLKPHEALSVNRLISIFSMQDGAGDVKGSALNEKSGNKHLLPPNIRPSNFILIWRPNDEINGTWVIDPRMKIEERDWNLELLTTESAITAEIFFLPSSAEVIDPSAEITAAYNLIKAFGGRVSLNIVGFLIVAAEQTSVS